MKIVPSKKNGVISLVNINDKKFIKREHDATIELLQHINACDTTDELSKLAADFFKSLSGCMHISIRLHGYCDFSSIQTYGFSTDSRQYENTVPSPEEKETSIDDRGGTFLIDLICEI